MASYDLTLYTGTAANPLVVHLFLKERTGLPLINQQRLDIFSNENRKPPYRTVVNARGELPALKVRSQAKDIVLTEVTAICEFLDEIASAGDSLFGKDALERAETHMWIRRMDLEIATPVHAYYRNDPDTIDFYKGWRIPTPEARLNQRVMLNQALNLLDEELHGNEWICGSRFSAADIFLYGMIKLMTQPVPFIVLPGRKDFMAWMARMDARSGSQAALADVMAGYSG